MAATLLTAGAGEAFETTRQGLPTRLLYEHPEAGPTLRLLVIGLTAGLVAWMLIRRREPRAGHLGAELVWGPATT
jgi:hypothetical protein